MTAAAEPQTAAAQPLLVARGLTKHVQDGEQLAAILQDVSLHVQRGERIALVGPSGSGKSTLLHILGGLDNDFAGSVQVEGQQLAGLTDNALAQLRNRTFGFVFQAYNLLSQLSALENVLLPAAFAGDERQPERALALLDQVGLASKAHRRPNALSGGERQRVAIARALYQQPKIVFCDEPTGNLDTATAAGVLALFDSLSARGITLILATHDAAIAANAHRTLRLVAGRLQP